MSELERPPSVVVAGHVTLDRYGDVLVPGGSAYFAAGAYRALGAHLRAVTAASGDFPAGALAGAEVVIVPSALTSRWTNTYGPDGARVQRVEAIATPLDPGSLPRQWVGADLLHQGL